MGVPGKSMALQRGVYTYPTAKDTFVSQNLSTSDRGISSHDSYSQSNSLQKYRQIVLVINKLIKKQKKYCSNLDKHNFHIILSGVGRMKKKEEKTDSGNLKILL